MNFDKLVKAIDKNIEMEYRTSLEYNEEDDMPQAFYYEGRGDALAALRAAIDRGYFDN